MEPTIRRSISLVIFFLLTLVAIKAQGQPDDQHPTAVEIARLPTFCWGQFRVPDAVGPEFSIAGCGPAMNHYCIGLIDLIRAKSATNKRGRLTWLGFADANIRYTENTMKDYPSCSLREHVAASRAEVDKFMLLYGGRRPTP